MAQSQKTKLATELQMSAVRATRVHFVYIAAYMLSIVIFDSWNLITHEDVLQRWTAAALMVVINTVMWYLARQQFKSQSVYRYIIFTTILADIIFAAYNVFSQRGMASKSVALFAVPIITAATLKRRSVILAATSLSVAAYSTAAVRYFYLHYGEGFRVQLYGEIFFYSALFFVMALLLLVVVRPDPKRV